MNYNTLSQEEYIRATTNLIAEVENFEPKSYDLKDSRATIGFGYTFNRDNNTALWEQAGISLTEDEKKHLQRIDTATTNSEKTRLGLEFPRELTKEEARSLLQTVLSDYEGPAENLGMPYSTERAALVAITYNRHESNVEKHMKPFLEAVDNGDRSEAYYQLRYQSWGKNQSAEKGLRKARAMEAQAFGLFDDPANVTPAEAENVYNTFKNHLDDIQHLEAKWGVDLNGMAADENHNIVAMANRDYPDSTAIYGAVPSIRQALEPAKTQYLHQLREQFPAQADQLTDRAYWTGAIHVTHDSNNVPQLSIDANKIALHQGDRGLDVQALQEQLAALHYTANDKQKPLVPDSDFGRGTAFAVSAFQKEHQLTVSGIADAATQKALREAVQTQKQGSNQQPQNAEPTQNTPAQHQSTSPGQSSLSQPAAPSGNAAPHPSQTQSLHSEQHKQVSPQSDTAPTHTTPHASGPNQDSQHERGANAEPNNVKADPSQGNPDSPNRASRLMDPDLRAIFESNGDPAVMERSAQNYRNSPSGQLFDMQAQAAAARVQPGAPEQQAAQAPRVQQSGPSIG